jgi:hypothetical protein
MKHELIEYVKKNVNGQNQKVGVLYGTIVENGIGIGWSKTNVKAKDEFDPEYGLKIAKNRSNAMNVNTLPRLPSSMKTPVKNFEKRCLRYFKGKFFNVVIVDFPVADLPVIAIR